MKTRKTRRWSIVVLTLMMCLTIWGKGNEMEKDQRIIQATDLVNLPEPVQRFMEYSQVVGTPFIQKARIKQTGLFKMDIDKPWAPFTAEQEYDIPSASFVWKVNMKMAPFIRVTGSDRLENGIAHMRIKLLGFIPVVNAKGPEMDQGAMTRYLSEIIWFPQAFLDKHITWEAIDSSSAKATLTIKNKSVEGVFHFDETGRFTEFTCDRYFIKGDEKLFLPWSTPVYEYGQRQGLQLATKGKAIWDHPDGEYTYIDVEVTEVEYE